jgi:Spy/CpxP family protein refolding chaperone
MTRSVTLLRRTLILFLTAAALLALPASAHAFSIGMSDQKLGMWEDPRFQQLGIKQVRLLVYYNQVLAGDFSRYDQWMAQAHARGADVLLTINQHSTMSKTRLPSVSQ